MRRERGIRHWQPARCPGHPRRARHAPPRRRKHLPRATPRRREPIPILRQRRTHHACGTAVDHGPVGRRPPPPREKTPKQTPPPSSRDVQRRLLDEFGVDPKLVAATATRFRERETAQREFDERRTEVARAREHKSLVSYQIDELTALGDSIHRFEELTATYKRLTRARELIETIGGATNELDEELIVRTSRLAGLLHGTDEPHPNLRAALDLATAAHTHLEETLGELRRYLDSFPGDDRELANVDAELAALHEVARKHRVPARDLGAHLARLTTELASLTVNENRLADLETRAGKAETKFRAAGESLSKARRRVAATFSKAVSARFGELGLADASLDVAFEDAETAAGLETVEFKVTTNPSTLRAVSPRSPPAENSPASVSPSRSSRPNVPICRV